MPARSAENRATRDSTATTCGILLAAGGGSRFGGETHKLVAPLRGRAVFEWALETAEKAALDHLVVVTGAVDLTLPDTVVRVHNPRWAEGQATSLQCGIRAADELGMEAVVVGLGDQPFVVAESWQALAAATSPIAVATYDGRRGNPVRLHRSVWSLLPTEGDEGARNLVALRPELVSEVACKGSPADIDTMEDLRQWNSSTNSQ
jgi:molybdenum cofactor cytidylyltransferase